VSQVRVRVHVADDSEAARRVRSALELSRDVASALGFSALHACQEGRYENAAGSLVDLTARVDAARAAKVCLPPDAPLPETGPRRFTEMTITVANETTMSAARRLAEAGHSTLALNFANGVSPGGGFLHGALAQEEVLCRSSALFLTLDGDPMYEAHRRRSDHASSDWAILSPDVPFFRTDDGTPVEAPWCVAVITCAAPIADGTVSDPAGLLRQRIHRVLAIAEAYRYDALVLGAWGCGAFRNDPAITARDFRDALCGPYSGAFAHVVFAIADWSPERRFLGPFRDAFQSAPIRPRGC
jgi:uncharacterized protein (TIGR02452 family)